MMYDAIVLGAGIAGLAAARELAENGRRVLLLEAQDRIGGRMYTRGAARTDHAVELGAEFIHGQPPELLALLDEAGLATVETSGDQLCYRNSRISSCGADAQPWELLDAMDHALAAHGDMSFDAYLAMAEGTPEIKRRARDYVEGFNAADAGEIGIAGLIRQQVAEDAIQGDRSARVVAGYGALAKHVRDRAVASGAAFLLETPVDRVVWQPGSCTVHADEGRQWQSRQLVCALPLGVLQSGTIAFDPSPVEAFHAAARLRAGSAMRLVLEFDRPWWVSRYPRMRFLFAQGLFPPTWWSAAPETSPLLTAWAGGPQAARFFDKDALVEDALTLIERMFAEPVRPLLLQAHYHDWQRDRWAQGAYSYAPAGAAAAAGILAEPVSGTLFFAGEHTDITGHPGTVHGALRSGLRAARQIIAASGVPRLSIL